MSMIKILHGADFHLGARFQSLPPEKAALRRREQLDLLDQLLRLRQLQACDLVLLAGDLLDRPQVSREIIRTLKETLEAMEVPVFLAPGNHDHLGAGSPYLDTVWPDNVHIFTTQKPESVNLPELDCRVWGAGYRSMDCPALLEGFRATGREPVQLMVLHGDPLSKDSPCCPVTKGQIAGSALQYLALGHVHKAGQLLAGKTLCAWPGCLMGCGFDETGAKGILLAEVSEREARAQFVPLDAGRYENLTVPVGDDPLASVQAVLPPDTARDVYRIVLTGEAEPVELTHLQRALDGRFFDLQLLDRTAPPRDLWERAGEDSLEGTYFQILLQAMEHAQGPEREALCLAARISRQLLDGQEVVLP